MKSSKAQKAKLDRVTLKAITGVAGDIEKRVAQLRKPEVTYPVRSLGNVRYDPRKDHPPALSVSPPPAIDVLPDFFLRFPFVDR